MRTAWMPLLAFSLLVIGSPASACSITPSSLNFGTVDVDSYRDLTFTVTATGEGAIEGFVSANCSHYKIISGEGGFFLYSGESMNVTVRFRPTEAGTHTCMINLDPSSCPPVSCTGTGAEPPLCSIDPLSLDFGDVIVGERDTLSFFITNIGGSILNGSVTEGCGDYSVVSGSPYSLGAGGSREIRIEFAPTTTGPSDCFIDGGLDCGEVYCDGNGIAPPECHISASTLDFETVLLGESDTLSFTIENTGDLPFGGSVGADCEGFALVEGAGAYTLEPGMTRAVSIAFSPISMGAHSCTVSTGTPYCADVISSGVGDLPPACSVFPEELEFGTSFVGAGDTLSFSITNTGGGALTGEVTETCPEFTILDGGGSFALGAGESLEAIVRFHPAQPGEAVCSIETGSDCPDVACVGWGEALPACSLGMSALDFGEVWLDSSRVLSFTITNAGGGILAGEVSESCGGFALSGGEGAFELAAGASRLVEVEFRPESLGVFTCAIETGVDDCPVVDCSGTGTAEVVCGLSPETLDFGLVAVGEMDTLSFEISSLGEGLLVGSVGGTCGPFRVIGGAGVYELSEGESHAVVVEFAPTEIGFQTCDLNLGAEACSTLHLSGSGDTPPVCSLDPGVLDFGSVAVGESATVTFTITNDGGGILSGEVAADCGGVFRVAGGGGTFALTAGGSRQVSVRFAPVSVGAATCPIETGSESCGTVTASGVGSAPPVCSITPAELDFGILPVGEIADTGLTITNTGGDTLRGTIDAGCGPFEIVDLDRAYSLAAGESRTFTLRFEPPGAGEYGCFLSVGSSCGDLALAGESRSCFMRLVQPGGGTEWPHGTTIPISWEEAGCSPSVRIDLLDEGDVCAVIVESTENDGDFAWAAEPCGTAGGTEYTIRLTDLADTLFSYEGPEEPFSIPAAPVLRFSTDTVSVSYDPLGPAEIDRPDALGLVVTNQGSAPLILHAGTTSPWIAVEPDSITLGPAESETLWVHADPRALRSGFHVGAVDLETNSPADPVATIRVEFDITEYAPGDVNGDHQLDALDVAALIDHILELVPLRDAVLHIGLPDLNGDSLVNVADVVRLARGIAAKALCTGDWSGAGVSGEGAVATARPLANGGGVELGLEGCSRPRAVLLRLHVDETVLPLSLEATSPGADARVILAREGSEIALFYYELGMVPAKGRTLGSAAHPLAFLSGENLDPAALSFLWGEVVSYERSVAAVTGSFPIDSDAGEEERSLLTLVQPNPFAKETVVSFSIPNPIFVNMDVFSIEGRRIRTLVQEETSSGLHHVVWDGRDSAGRLAASGIYFLRIRAGEKRETRRIVLLR